MASRLYRVIVYQNPGEGPDDGWDVIFPDFPGCITQGNTPEEAIENAKEALALHIEGMVAEGQELPASSRINERLPDWALETNLLPNAIHVFLPIPGESARINITMDKALVDRIDDAAKREGTTRSGYLAQAVREKLQRSKEPA